MLISKLKGNKLPGYPAECSDPKYPLFVTWTTMSQDDLRGCIGTFDQSQNMSKLLPQYALISSLEDDRFDPVTLDEVSNLKVGLSLLCNF